jgi:SAM-dependent methyltransferase
MAKFALLYSIETTKQNLDGMVESPQRDLIGRTNMLCRTTETWRPPLFLPSGGRWSAPKAALRRFLDLQAGSIWRDLKNVLPHVTGAILDVGCGAQPYRSLIPAAARYIGIDSAASKDHFGYDIPDTLYFTGDHWPVEDASVDFILCAEVLEHVPDSQRFLSEAFRCLKPGGVILFTVPFAARWHFIPYDYWRFTPSGLDRVLDEAGFVDTRVYARGNAFTVACYKVMALLLRLAVPQVQTTFLRLILQILFIPFLPLFMLLALFGNWSLLDQGGDDCLGFTATSKRKST